VPFGWNGQTELAFGGANPPADFAGVQVLEHFTEQVRVGHGIVDVLFLLGPRVYLLGPDTSICLSFSLHFWSDLNDENQGRTGLQSCTLS
jgi:hypothetical protein